jgi:hypothetical protein
MAFFSLTKKGVGAGEKDNTSPVSRIYFETTVFCDY